MEKARTTFPPLPAEREADRHLIYIKWVESAKKRSNRFGNGNSPRRGEVYLADLNPVMGCEEGGIRPVVVVQNNTGNRHGPTVVVAPVTVRPNTKATLPTHVSVYLPGDVWRVAPDPETQHSVVLTEQIRTLDKGRLKKRLYNIKGSDMDKVDAALRVSLALG